MPFNVYLNKIGSSNYSVVTKVTHKTLGPVAVKVDIGGLLENELLYLNKLQHHPNVIQVYGRYQAPGQQGIVMELMSYNLSQVIEKTYGPREMYSWFYQVCSALAAMHEMEGTMSVLLDEKMSIVKVIDFGISKADRRTEMTTRVGTVPFMAPEVADGSSNYNISADVYSLGITIFVTATKQSVEVGWKNRCWDWNKKISDDSLRIAVDRMLGKDIEKRPSMRRLRDYFDKLVKENICDISFLEPDDKLVEIVEKLEYKELPCYGVDDFLTDEEPLKPIKSVAKEGSHRLVLYPMSEVTSLIVHGEYCQIGFDVLGETWLKLNSTSSFYISLKALGVKSTAAVQFSRELVARLSIPPHPNIVQFFGAVYDQDIETPCGLLMEYMHGGSLLEYLRHDQSQPVEVLNGWAMQIARGVSFMHSEGIMHRDVKPSNVLLSRNLLVAKICDFKLAKKDDHNNTEKIGTLEYTAPEVFLSLDYSFPVDVYSYAMTLYFIYYKQEPFEEELKVNTRAELYWRITKTVAPLRPKLGTVGESLAAQDRLIEMCWNYYPDKRPTFLEICGKLWDIEKEEERRKRMMMW